MRNLTEYLQTLIVAHLAGAVPLVLKCCRRAIASKLVACDTLCPVVVPAAPGHPEDASFARDIALATGPTGKLNYCLIHPSESIA